MAIVVFGLITTRVFSVFVFVRLVFFKRVVTYDNLIQ
jgi:hypothetical protein